MGSGEERGWARLVLATALASALTAGACGDTADEALLDDEVEAGVTPTVAPDETPTVGPEEPSASEPTPAPTAAPTETVVAADIAPDEWLAMLDAALVDLRAEERLLLEALIGNFSNEGVITFRRATADRFAAFRSAVGSPPADLATAGHPLMAAADAVIDEMTTSADEIEVDELDMLAEPPSDRVIELQESFQEVLDGFQARCFDLQADVAALGLRVVDCIGSDLVEPGDSVGEGRHVLASGEHRFETTTRPFTLAVDEPVEVIVADAEVRVQPDQDGPGPDLLIIAIEQIVAPGSAASAFVIDDPELVPVPTDLTEWLAALPWDVVGQGTLAVGDTDGHWWRFRHPTRDEVELEPGVLDEAWEPLALGPGGRSNSFYLVNDFYAVDSIYFPYIGTIPHPDGPLLFLAGGVPAMLEPDVGITPEEAFAFAEQTLSGLRFIEPDQG